MVEIIVINAHIFQHTPCMLGGIISHFLSAYCYRACVSNCILWYKIRKLLNQKIKSKYNFLSECCIHIKFLLLNQMTI